MKRQRKIGFGCIFYAGMILLCQCSPYAGGRLLTFFFDGVPEADTAPVVSKPGAEVFDSIPDQAGAMALNEAAMRIHDPYAEKECSACHDEHSLGSMTEPQPGLCYLCLEDLSEKYACLHGPVAGGYCTACHDPHSSKNEKLLKFKGDELCFYCHQEKHVFRNEMHEGLDGMACSDCHNSHGGEQKFLIEEHVPFGNWEMNMNFIPGEEGGILSSRMPWQVVIQQAVKQKSP